MEDHPHEKDEILVLEDFSVGGDESSDDVEIDVFETPVTPRGNADDDLLKSNTSMSHTGNYAEDIHRLFFFFHAQKIVNITHVIEQS